MESVYDKYESVIGLEVHIQLLTKSKAYSSDSNEFGAIPNTNIKESKESAFWLRLIGEKNQLDNKQTAINLNQEPIELKKIFSAIAEKSK